MECNNIVQFQSLVKDMDMDAVVLTETWLKGDDSDQKIIGDLTPSEYTFRHIPRIIKTGGNI